MNFGSWDSTIHDDVEQLKRIATAKKADTTPASVDRENKTAEFKGSGKNPYITTLYSCLCGDFVRRKLPCKHIYRLVLELEGAEVQQGVNKNEYAEPPFDVLALPEQSQKILYDMCVANIYHGEKSFVYERNEYSDLLFAKGFFIQSVPTLDMLSALPLPLIKRALYDSCGDMEGLPKKTAQRKSVLPWLAENFDSVFPLIDNRFVFLEFTEHADRTKSVIHRRISKKINPPDDDLVIEIKLNYSDKNTPPTASIESYRKQ